MSRVSSIENIETNVEMDVNNTIKFPIKNISKYYFMAICLKKITQAYSNLNFKELYELLADNCVKKSTSANDNYNTITSKDAIIKSYENLVKVAKRNNLTFEGILIGDDFNLYREPLLAIQFIVKEKNKNVQRIFCLSIKMNKYYLINRIYISNKEEFPKRYLKRVKNGRYERILNDNEIEFLLNFKKLHLEEKSEYEKILNDNEIEFFLNFKKLHIEEKSEKEKKLKEFYSNFSFIEDIPYESEAGIYTNVSFFKFMGEDAKNILINYVLRTYGKLENNKANLECEYCSCKYIAHLYTINQNKYHMKYRMKSSESRELFINEYLYGFEHKLDCLCLGCGRKWGTSTNY